MVKYSADPRGDKIAGLIVTNFGGQERETPFEGARVETPKSDKETASGDDDDAEDNKDDANDNE